MGFNVDSEQKLVTVDHSHNHFCITTPEGNPVHLLLEQQLKVTSIFARTKGKRDPHMPGDNCPMLYVIKGLHQLKTNRRDIAKLCTSFRKILPLFIEQGFQWDWLVPLPSGSHICRRFAGRVQKITQKGLCVESALAKVNALSVKQYVRALRISAKDKTRINADINRFISEHGEEEPFQIKAIKNVSLRRFINPFCWGCIPFGTPPPQKILLIDDMVTSGTSLISAQMILQSRYPFAQIEALTLFGSSR